MITLLKHRSCSLRHTWLGTLHSIIITHPLPCHGPPPVPSTGARTNYTDPRTPHYEREKTPPIPAQTQPTCLVRVFSKTSPQLAGPFLFQGGPKNTSGLHNPPFFGGHQQTPTCTPRFVYFRWVPFHPHLAVPPPASLYVDDPQTTKTN